MKPTLLVSVYGQHCAIAEQRSSGPHALSTWVRSTGATLTPRYAPSGRRLTHRGSFVWETRDANGKKIAGGTVKTLRQR
jgi:2-polyprenyl-6-methoxyphenol hydroxylase-like FAD-dependent oxidoreductase